MTKVIDLDDKHKYRQKINDIKQYLAQVEVELTTLAINLAMISEWKEWDDKQKNGMIAEFSDQSLRETGDENIQALVELKIQLRNTNDKLTEG